MNLLCKKEPILYNHVNIIESAKIFHLNNKYCMYFVILIRYQKSMKGNRFIKYAKLL